MMRKVLWAFSILLIGIFIGHFINRLQARQTNPGAPFFTPTLELANMTITKLTKEEVNMSMDVLLDNPLPFGFEIDSFTFALAIGGKEVVSSTYPDPLELNGYDRTVVSMPISAEQQLLLGTLKELDNKGVDSVVYGVDVAFTKKFPLIGERPLSFHVERYLPLFLLPGVEVKDLDLQKLGLNDTRLLLALELTNENNGSIAIRDTKVTLRVGDDRVLTTKVDSVICIPAKDKVDISLPLRIDLGEALGTMMKFLLQPGTAYQFQLDAIVVSDSKTTNGTVIHVQRDGVLKELKEMK